MKQDSNNKKEEQNPDQIWQELIGIVDELPEKKAEFDKRLTRLVEVCQIKMVAGLYGRRYKRGLFPKKEEIKDCIQDFWLELSNLQPDKPYTHKGEAEEEVFDNFFMFLVAENIHSFLGYVINYCDRKLDSQTTKNYKRANILSIMVDKVMVMFGWQQKEEENEYELRKSVRVKYKRIELIQQLSNNSYKEILTLCWTGSYLSNPQLCRYYENSSEWQNRPDRIDSIDKWVRDKKYKAKKSFKKLLEDKNIEQEQIEGGHIEFLELILELENPVHKDVLRLWLIEHYSIAKIAKILEMEKDEVVKQQICAWDALGGFIKKAGKRPEDFGIATQASSTFFSQTSDNKA